MRTRGTHALHVPRQRVGPVLHEPAHCDGLVCVDSPVQQRAARGVACVQRRAARAKKLEHDDPAVLRGDVRRRVALAVDRGQVRAARGKEMRGLERPGRRPVQRGLATAVARVDVGAAVQKICRERQRAADYGW